MRAESHNPPRGYLSERESDVTVPSAMNEAVPEPQTDREAPAGPEPRFEQAVDTYTALRMSPARSVALLIHAGFPIELIRARFPDVSAAAFNAPCPIPTQTRPEIAPESARLESQRGAA